MLEQVTDAELERVMTAAVRLYAAKAELENPTVRPITPEMVTPTDVVVTVSALIRSAGLSSGTFPCGSIGRIDDGSEINAAGKHRFGVGVRRSWSQGCRLRAL